MIEPSHIGVQISKEVNIAGFLGIPKLNRVLRWLMMDHPTALILCGRNHVISSTNMRFVFHLISEYLLNNMI